MDLSDFDKKINKILEDFDKNGLFGIVNINERRRQVKHWFGLRMKELLEDECKEFEESIDILFKKHQIDLEEAKKEGYDNGYNIGFRTGKKLAN